MNATLTPRALRDRALVLSLGWLLVQNGVLLSLAPWERLGVLSTVGSAMLKAAWVLLAPIVTTVLTAVLAWTFVNGLLGAPIAGMERDPKELRHG